MANLKQNRSGIFYYEGALTGSYDDNNFKLQGTCNVLKIAAVGAGMQFSLIGGGSGGVNDLDGSLVAGEELDFTGLEFSRLALRGAGATVRVWAY